MNIRYLVVCCAPQLTHVAQEMGKDVTATWVEPKPQRSPQEIHQSVQTILQDKDMSQQVQAWKDLGLKGFGKSDLRTFPVSLGMLENRADITPASLGLDQDEVSLDDFKYSVIFVTLGSGALGVASLAFLPPNVGATLCYLLALLPILFLGIGSTAPQLIANVIVGLRGGNDQDGVSQQERRTRHEAAHFCTGYWCGLPIEGYSVDNGVAQVEFGAPATKYTSVQVAALCVTALSGLVAEASQYGSAKGAQNDLLVLEDVFRRADDFIGAQAQQDLTRWGALQAAILLQENASQYERVVEAFGRQASVEECVAILES